MNEVAVRIKRGKAIKNRIGELVRQEPNLVCHVFFFFFLLHLICHVKDLGLEPKREGDLVRF